MKQFFDYDADSPQERQEQFKQYPELSKFYIALSEELAPEEYEKFCEAEKQSFYLFNPRTKNQELQWIQ